MKPKYEKAIPVKKYETRKKPARQVSDDEKRKKKSD